jgi:L-fuculose-phosphate aldolase
MSGAEERARTDLTAARHILAREDCDSGVFGFVAVRRPGADGVLVTPMGFADLLRPDDVVTIGLHDGPDDLPATVSAAVGMALAVLRMQSHVDAVVHTHSHYASVVSATSHGIGIFNELSTMYDDEQVVVTDDGDRSPSACDRLAAALGPRRVLLLHGHGVLVAAANVADAAMDALAVEKAARWDVAARAYDGAEIVRAHIDQTKPLYNNYFRKNMWQANLRRLLRAEPDLFAAR